MKEKGHDSSFDVTKGSYDGGELCEWIGIYIQSLLEKLLGKGSNGFISRRWTYNPS